MARKDYMPTEEAARALLFTNFKNKIGAYAVLLGIPPARIASQAADADWFAYMLAWILSLREDTVGWVNYKDQLLEGEGPVSLPAPPVMPETGASAVEPGILARFRDLVRTVKAAEAYTEAIGETLGIVGPEEDAPDPATLAPQISVRIEGFHVVLKWKKGMMDGLQVQCDRGNGIWVNIGTSMRPDFTDPEPFPATPATWRYRAIYLKGNATYGQLSNTATITVGG